MENLSLYLKAVNIINGIVLTGITRSLQRKRRLWYACSRKLEDPHVQKFTAAKLATYSFCATHPVHPQFDERRSCPIVKRRGGCRSVDPDGEQPNNSTVTLNTRNDMISIHQRSVRTNECKITLSWNDRVINCFIISDTEVNMLIFIIFKRYAYLL